MSPAISAENTQSMLAVLLDAFCYQETVIGTCSANGLSQLLHSRHAKPHSNCILFCEFPTGDPSHSNGGSQGSRDKKLKLTCISQKAHRTFEDHSG